MVKSGSSPRPKISDLRSEIEAEQVSNVTLRGRESQGSFPCPTCNKLRAVGLTKRKKPYFTCNDCGVQVFFRGQEGIRRFREMLGHGELDGNIGALSPLLEHVAFLRRRLREIRQEKPILGEDSGLEVEEKLVESELSRAGIILKTALKEARKQLREFKRDDDD